MKKIIPFLFLYLVVSNTLAQTSFVLTAERNAYRPADEIIKQQVVFRDPGSRGKASFGTSATCNR